MSYLKSSILEKLELTSPNVFFFFGLAGSGKSYVIDLLARKTGWYAYDADQDLTDEMREALNNQEMFTDQMRFDYIKKVVNKINILSKDYKKLLVAQANYKQKYRDYVRANLKDAYDFIYISATDSIIYERLKTRNDNLDLDYFKKISVNFEEPDISVKEIHNIKSNKEIVDQFLGLYL